MKVCLHYKSDSIHPNRVDVVECEKVSTMDHSIKFFNKSSHHVAFKLVNLDQIAEYHVVGEFQLETKLENYLNEHGDVAGFYRGMIVSKKIGLFFFSSLNKMDQYRLIMSGSRDVICGDEAGYDSPVILQAIEFLEETEEKYPENHPLRKLAKKG